jgi:hypothetical protein
MFETSVICQHCGHEPCTCTVWQRLIRGERVDVDEIERHEHDAPADEPNKLDERTADAAKVLAGAAAAHLRREQYDFEAHGVEIAGAYICVDGNRCGAHHVVEAALMLVRGLCADLAEATDMPIERVGELLQTNVELHAAIGYAENVLERPQD